MANDLGKFLKSPAGIGLLVVALILFNVGGLRDTLTGYLAPAPSGGSGGSSTLPCLNDGATMTIGPMQVMWDPTATVPAHYSRVYVNGVNFGYKADGASMEVSVGDDITIYYGENASFDAPTVIPFVYTAQQKFKAPCKSDFTTGDPTLDNEAYKLYNSTQEDTTNLTATILCLSHDDGTENTGTAGDDIEWGDNYNVKCRLQGIHKKAFSPYGAPAMCLAYNETSWDIVEVLDANGNVYPKVDKPGFLKPTETVHTIRCFEFPKIMSSNTYDFQLHLDVADSGTAYTAPHYNNNISVFMVDQDWYEDSLTGEMVLGFETNLNVDVGSLDSANLYDYAIIGPD